MGTAPRRKVETVKVGTTLEIGHYEEMARMFERERKWKDEAALVREAIVEKIDRWRTPRMADAQMATAAPSARRNRERSPREGQ